MPTHSKIKKVYELKEIVESLGIKKHIKSVQLTPKIVAASVCISPEIIFQTKGCKIKRGGGGENTG